MSACGLWLLPKGRASFRRFHFAAPTPFRTILDLLPVLTPFFSPNEG